MVGNVKAITNNQSATLEDAKAWVKAMGERGKFTSSVTKYRTSAIDQLASVMAPDGDRTARSMLEQVDTLAADWGRKTNSDGKTVANYRGAVRSTLTFYLAFLDDPAKAQAQFDAAAAKKSKPKSKPTEKAETAQGVSPELPFTTPATVAAPPASSAAPRQEISSYPLGDGRVVLVGFPEKFSLRDLAKFSCYAATFCVDFDPTRPDQGTIVSMARKDEEKE